MVKVAKGTEAQRSRRGTKQGLVTALAAGLTTLGIFTYFSYDSLESHGPKDPPSVTRPVSGTHNLGHVAASSSCKAEGSVDKPAIVGIVGLTYDQLNGLGKDEGNFKDIPGMQLESKKDKNARVLGLGLYISATLADRYQGAVTLFESNAASHFRANKQPNGSYADVNEIHKPLLPAGTSVNHEEHNMPPVGEKNVAQSAVIAEFVQFGTISCPGSK